MEWGASYHLVSFYLLIFSSTKLGNCFFVARCSGWECPKEGLARGAIHAGAAVSMWKWDNIYGLEQEVQIVSSFGRFRDEVKIKVQLSNKLILVFEAVVVSCGSCKMSTYLRCANVDFLSAISARRHSSHLSSSSHKHPQATRGISPLLLACFPSRTDSLTLGPLYTHTQTFFFLLFFPTHSPDIQQWGKP